MRSYKENVIRVLHAYPPGSDGLVTAFEGLCRTAYEHGRKDAKMSLAEEVCEQMHHGPAKGLKCLQCYHAEAGFAAEEQVRAEMEMGKEEE